MFALLIFGALLFTSCRETVKEEKVIREVEKVEVDTEETANEGALERAAKEVDKEVNEEINKGIESIGDDN